MKQKIELLLLFILVAIKLSAQPGSIGGRVMDEKKQPIIGAVIEVTEGGVKKGGGVTDYDGNYLITQLNAGLYDVKLSYTGYVSKLVQGVIVKANTRTDVNAELSEDTKKLSEVTVIAYKMPLINVNNPNATNILTSEQIERMPTRSVYGAAPPSNVYQSQSSVDALKVQSYYKGREDEQKPETTGNYKKLAENNFISVSTNPLSTMSVDVDKASYSNVRRFLNEGHLPPADAIRIEEMVNYFDYEYKQPEGADPVAINTELTECPWNKEDKLLRIGIQAREIDKEKLPASNLVFLIDVSGSMDSPERLPLLISGMKLLVAQLRKKDIVTIVTYAGNAGLALDATSGSNKQKILETLERLQAGGSTAGGEGIQLAYKMAKKHFINGGNNRVLLATDGDFNVGISSDHELENLITEERKSGIFLSCLGFGTDNFKDAKMELMADKGNGNYNYIDNLQEAQKVLVHQFGGTLFTVAKDVKSQIEFNPAKVQAYRLLGYEDRLLNDEDFKDDKKDAGDMGSGHVVTILYELIPTGTQTELLKDTIALKYQVVATANSSYDNELATVKFRYKKPDGEVSSEMASVIKDATVDLKNASENTRFAASVAMFGMLLKNSDYMGSSDFASVIKLAEKSKTYDDEGYRAEFVRLVKIAQILDGGTASK